MNRAGALAWMVAAAALLSAQPVSLHPRNPHYFQFRGKPVVLVTSAEHYGSVLNPDFEYKRYLAALAESALNYTRIFGGSYVEVPSESFGIKRNTLAPARGRFLPPWARSDTAGYQGGGNKFDLDRWNPEYFDRYRAFLAEASRLGIIVEVTFFSSQYQETQWQVSPFNPANNVNGTDAIDWHVLNTRRNGNILPHQEKYVRKLVREAKGFDNVIFEIQNEPWSDRPALVDVVNRYLQPPARDHYPNAIEIPDDLSLEWQAMVAGWVTSEESALPNRHLIAQNWCNFGYPAGNLAPGVSIVNFHYTYPFGVSSNYGLGKAISYDETGFLGRSDDAYLSQAWNFLLSGGSVFNNLDYSFSVGHEDGSDNEPNGPGGGSADLRRQLRILSEFLHSFSLPDLHPDSETVEHVSGAWAHALSHPGREYAIYLDGSVPATLSLRLPAGTYTAQWVDPHSGPVGNPETVRHAGGRKSLQAPSFQHGMALRLTVRAN
jgi:hypothetical protein